MTWQMEVMGCEQMDVEFCGKRLQRIEVLGLTDSCVVVGRHIRSDPRCIVLEASGVQGYSKATPRLLQGYSEATPRLLRGYPEATPGKAALEADRRQG
ncbi:hypothetical protein HYFRA_00010083 [Hymenoscyphus fraxineus]|uniref:Uncharacterized protein n=1 Tax=Hymenoscyphus fraxineus TaxID=746836 RepID=A0A9N9KTH8_9HELO|nr:hypothetical protein HYFRA_00010083 [Hymenoscyphus fraxineus]